MSSPKLVSHSARSAVATLLLATGLAASPLLAQIPAPTANPIRTLDLPAHADARVQGTTATNFGSGDLTVGLPDKIAFLRFGFDRLPPGAVIYSAELVVSFRPDNLGPNQVEVGKVQGQWQENSLTAANQPAVNWKGLTKTAVGGSSARWDVKGAVTSWLDGSDPNYGFALRGDGPVKKAYSRETATAPSARPTLHIRYIVP